MPFVGIASSEDEARIETRVLDVRTGRDLCIASSEDEARIETGAIIEQGLADPKYRLIGR